MFFKDGGCFISLGTEKANVEANLDANMSSRDRAIMNQYKNLPTPTVTIGVDKFDNPITVPTTYTAKRARQQMLNALNEKKKQKFKVFFVSIDPERDTPEVMKNYLSSFENKIVGITGKSEKIFILSKSCFASPLVINLIDTSVYSTSFC